jgi:hypothetical protein
MSGGATCGRSVLELFLECPLYLNERRTLLSNCDDININIETLLFGNDDYSYDVNSKIFEKVRVLNLGNHFFAHTDLNYLVFEICLKSSPYKIYT